MAEVELKKVRKRFDDATEALRGISLTVADGELLVLVGPSGCGKSTLLRVLAGLEEADSGKILIDGRPVNGLPPQRRNIAMVFQNYALYPHMTVRGNLEFPLKMAGVPKGERAGKIQTIAAMLNLTELMDRRPAQLSGGQRQRVAMGRALVRDPRVFLLDEPLSNLDAKLRARIRAEIAGLQRRLDKTTLYVTHDQVEAMTLGDRVAVLNQGEVQQIGTPEELYATPQNIFVARFIGSPGMNILPAVLELAEGGAEAVIGHDRLRLPIPEDRLSEQKLASGTPLQVGLRPEAFTIAAGQGRMAITVRVTATEFLGHETLLFFQDPAPTEGEGGAPLIARIPGHQPAATDGQSIQLFIDPAALCLFDDQGNALS